jgi:hypothetical protein
MVFSRLADGLSSWLNKVICDSSVVCTQWGELSLKWPVCKARGSNPTQDDLANQQRSARCIDGNIRSRDEHTFWIQALPEPVFNGAGSVCDEPSDAVDSAVADLASFSEPTAASCSTGACDTSVVFGASSSLEVLDEATTFWEWSSSSDSIISSSSIGSFP